MDTQQNPITAMQERVEKHLLTSIASELSDNTPGVPMVDRRVEAAFEAMSKTLAMLLAPVLVPTRMLDIVTMQTVDRARFERAAKLALSSTFNIHEAWDRS